MRSGQDVEFILYVKDQKRSTEFYKLLLKKEPALEVEGMTEFVLNPFSKLGLMPNHGIAKIISGPCNHPDMGQGIPRCELYLKVSDPYEMFKLALYNGASAVSEAQPRDWGDLVAYVSDPDGHILAFAATIGELA